ncbi:hypothetical protein KAR26_02780 [Candidatus Parcubacteria bacterium]|nr:hypothetical protein [Candidatus Parcubacteria bacterium]
MDLFDELKDATRLGELKWRPTQEKEKFCYYNGNPLVKIQGYTADYKAYSIKIIVRKVSRGLKKIPLIGLSIEKLGKKITLVSQLYKNCEDQCLGKQIIVEEGTVPTFAIEMQNIIERRDFFGSLEIELEKAMRNKSSKFIND